MWRHHADGTIDAGLMIDDLLYVAIALVSLAIVSVGIALSRNVYRTTLRMHAQRTDQAAQRLKRSDISFLKSMHAEEAIEQTLREEGWSHVFLRRRVPLSRVGHNREIDVVAVGPVILVIEVKNWQGYVWSNGPRWYQKPGQQTLEFEDVMEDNVVKAAALRRHLENTHRVLLPDFAQMSGGFRTQHEETSEDGAPAQHGTWYSDASLHKQCGQCIIPIVVFTNRRVKLDPATVKAKKFVFDMNTFRVFAREALRGNLDVETFSVAPSPWQDKLPRWTLALLPFPRPLAGEDDVKILDGHTQNVAANAVDVLRTWDVVYFHDGSMVTGDVQNVNMPNAHCMYERKHLLDVNLRWNTGIIGTLKAVLLNNAGSIELILVTAKRLARKKKENKPRNEEGNIIFPIVPKNRRNPNLCDRLVIKPAGSTKLHTYAFADIREVRLSHHLYEVEKHL